MRSARTSARGFTLTELIVVILLIGILAAFGIPQYMKALENSKAEDAASLTNMIGTANRMYALDHNGTFAAGTLATGCGTLSCVGAGQACDLVACKYVASVDFDNKPYAISVGASCANGATACARRSTSGTSGTNTSPYSTWGYSVDASGTITPLNGAPTPAN